MENLLNTIIETERLVLRPVALEHAKMIFPEFTDEVTKFMYPRTPKRVEDTEKYIQIERERMEKGLNLSVAIFDKETGELLGGGGIHHIDTKTPELGIWIKKSAHGNKFGREAVAGLKKWADENLEYDYLTYPVVKVNIASRKIPESLGGKLIKEMVKKNEAGEEMEEVEYWIYR